MRSPKAVQPTALAAGALALISGVGALVGWQTGWDAALRLRPTWPAVSPAAAVGLIGCGIAALSVGLERARRVGLASASVAALMGVLGLAGHDLLQTSWIAGAAAVDVRPLQRMTAVSLLLAGTSLALLRARVRAAERATPLLWIFGVVVACFGGAALLAQISGLGLYYDGWSHLADMAVPAAASLLALGVAILVRVAQTRDAEQTLFARFSWMGIGVGAGVASAAIALWAALVHEEQRHVERTVRHAVSSTHLYVARSMNERVNNLVRMAERWAVGRDPLREEWEADAQLHVAHDPALEALAWIDPRGRPRLFVAGAGASSGASDLERRVRADAFDRPRDVRVSDSFPLPGGATGFAVYAPIWDADRYSGSIVAVFRAGTALAPALQETWQRYDLLIRDAGGDLVRLVRSDASPRLVQEGELHMRGSTWQIRAWPNPVWLAELQSGALHLALGAGLALAVLSGSTLSLARTARQRLRSVQGLLESAPDAMIVVDVRGDVVLGNAEAERLFGWRRDELVGRSVDGLVPERLLSRHREGRERYFAEPARRPQDPLEVTARRRDGSEFPAEISLRAIASERGPLVSSSIRDLTGRRDEELRRRLAAIVTSSHDAIIGRRLDGTIAEWNRGAERIYGWTAEEAVGRHIDLIVPEERRDELERLMGEVRRGEVTEQLETVRVRKDGERIDVSLSVSPIRDEHGDVIGAASIGHDVGELRRAREDLRVQRDALAAVNAELARSNADLDQFAAVVSHDLKAPLRGIAALAEWVVEEEGEALSDEGRERLTLIQARVLRMFRLIEGILEYSRAGRSTKLEPVDSRATLVDVLDALAPPAGIEVQLGPDLPTVIYDETQLVQVLQNLVENAIRHIGRPSGTVRVDACERADAWEFRVADDGVGIPEHQRERIFRIFQRLSRDDGSTGVGLAVVKKVVESNGGRVWVTEAPGGGAEFHFTVPRPNAANL